MSFKWPRASSAHTRLFFRSVYSSRVKLGRNRMQLCCDGNIVQARGCARVCEESRNEWDGIKRTRRVSSSCLSACGILRTSFLSAIISMSSLIMCPIIDLLPAEAPGFFSLSRSLASFSRLHAENWLHSFRLRSHQSPKNIAARRKSRRYQSTTGDWRRHWNVVHLFRPADFINSAAAFDKYDWHSRYYNRISDNPSPVCRNDTGGTNGVSFQSRIGHVGVEYQEIMTSNSSRHALLKPQLYWNIHFALHDCR